MSYIQIVDDEVLLFGEVKPDDVNDYIYVQEVPHIDVPEFQKLRYDRKLYVDTNVDALREYILQSLLTKYKQMIANSDDELLAYQKRQQLNMLTDKDLHDYKQALVAYEQATLWYRMGKDKIKSLDEKGLIEYYKTMMEAENANRMA